jgi:hypothetical protein
MDSALKWNHSILAAKTKRNLSYPVPNSSQHAQAGPEINKKKIARESTSGVYIVHSLAFPLGREKPAGHNGQIRMNPTTEVVL